MMLREAMQHRFRPIGLASEAALHGGDPFGLASEATLHETACVLA
jgi:hypothetical protein